MGSIFFAKTAPPHKFQCRVNGGLKGQDKMNWTERNSGGHVKAELLFLMEFYLSIRVCQKIRGNVSALLLRARLRSSPTGIAGNNNSEDNSRD